MTDNYQEEYLHELKNCISNLLNCNKLANGVLANGVLANDKLVKVKEFIDMQNTILNHIENLTEDYTLFLKTNRTTIKYSNFYIDDVILSIIKSISVDNKYKVIVKYKLVKYKVYTDLTMFTIVMMNLISNAIKYSNENSTVNVECYNVKQGTKVIISDAGIGMDAIELKNYGTPFYRCKKIERDGIGLGAALVKKIAIFLNLNLTIQSKPKSGTKISFIIEKYQG